MSKKNTIFIIVAVFTVVAFFLRVLPFGYATSPIYFDHPDLLWEALNIGKAVAERDLSPLKVFPPYPYFFSYIFLLFFGIVYLAGIIGGAFASAAEFINYVILQMDQLHEITRIIVSVSGALLVPLVYLVTRRLVSEKESNKKNTWAITASLLAMLLMTFSLLHNHFGKVNRPFVPVSVLFFLSFCFYLILLKKKNFLSYIALGLAVGATAGTLQNGFLAIIFLFLGHFFLIHQQTRKTGVLNKLKKFISWQLIVSLISFLLVTALCYPHAVLSFKKALNLEEGKINLTLAGNEYHVDRSDQLSDFAGGGFITEIKGLFFYEPGLMIILLFLLGFLFMLRKKKEENKNPEELSPYYKQGAWGAIIFVVFYLILFGFYNNMRFRMLTPLIPFLCMITGIALFIVLNRASQKYKYWIIGFVGLILIIPIIQSVRLTTLTMKNSTQELAAKWIKTNIGANETIAIESHSRLRIEPSQESLKRRLDLLGPDSLGQRDQLLLLMSKDDYLKDSMMVFPIFVFKEDYDKIYNFLKTETDYLVLGRYASKLGVNPVEDPIYQISLPLNKVLLQKFSPFKNDSSKRISDFPQGLENPILDLWAYQRMGAVIEIYEFRRNN